MTTTYELARCAVCGEAGATEIANADDTRAEVESLWSFHSRRLRPDIPPSHLTDRVAFSQRPPVRVVRCDTCGLVYRNPVERPLELETIYDDAALAPDVLRDLHDTQRASYAAQARRLTRVFGRTGSGVEVGSYVGAFLAAARDAGWRFRGVDVNADANRFSRSLGFQVDDGTIESLGDDVQVDVVAIWNCLDQLADPASAIRAARRHLQEGGMLALRVPNGACYAALRPHLTGRGGWIAREWLAQNNLLAFPYRFGFTVGSLTRLVEQLGFRVVHVTSDVLVPIADEWTRPWAAMEERVLKRGLGAVVARVARGERVWAPWLEMYARVDKG